MSAATPESRGLSAWCILELLGHVRLAGLVTEEERFGTKMGRIDIPNGEGGFTTQYFSGGSIYRMTPTTEEIARDVAKCSQPQPVHAWEIRRLQAGSESAPPYAAADDDEDFDG